jgi:hypothetical protein
VRSAGTLIATLSWAQDELTTDLVGFGDYIVRGTVSGRTSAAISAPVRPGSHKIRIYNPSGGTRTCRPAGAYNLVVRTP